MPLTKILTSMCYQIINMNARCATIKLAQLFYILFIFFSHSCRKIWGVEWFNWKQTHYSYFEKSSITNIWQFTSRWYLWKPSAVICIDEIQWKEVCINLNLLKILIYMTICHKTALTWNMKIPGIFWFKFPLHLLDKASEQRRFIEENIIWLIFHKNWIVYDKQVSLQTRIL